MTTSHRSTPPVAWILRLTWMALPLLLGPVVADATSEWGDATRLTAELLAWAAWAAGVVSVLAPRPLSLTVVRLASAWGLGLALLSAASVAVVDVAGALAVTAFVPALLALPEIAAWFVNGAAYGDEIRLPLRAPAIITWVLAPVSTLLAGSALVSGPLLLANGTWITGGLALGLGIPIGTLLGRSLHGLSRRWLVLVPGGIVLHDPLTLSDPILLRRDIVASIEVFQRPPDPTSVDLRLGTAMGSVQISLTDVAPLPTIDRGRRSVDIRPATAVVVAFASPGDALASMLGRNLPVG